MASLSFRALKAAERLGSRLGLGRLRRHRWFEAFVFGLVQRRWHALSHPTVALVQGHTMELDPEDHLLLSLNGFYEPDETELVKQHVRPGSVAVDAGANVGYYTLLLARLVGPEGKVYAFEPHPANFETLRRNVEANGYRNVVLLNKALADRPGTLRLHLGPDAGSHSLVPTRSRASIEVEATSLDAALGPGARVDFLKMDVEGAEGRALRGMAGVLSASPDMRILMEFNTGLLRAAGTPPAGVVAGLARQGFAFHIVDPHEHRVDPVSGEAIASHEGEESLALWCTPRSDGPARAIPVHVEPRAAPRAVEA